MAAIGTLPVLFATGVHGSRPAASAVGKGGLYSCTTHSLVYQTDGSSWSTWATLTGTGLSDPMTTRGDIIVRNAANATARLAVGSSGKVLSSDGTDISWQTPSASTPTFVGCRVSLSTTQSIANNTLNVPVIYDTEDYDTDAIHSAGTFTIPAGKTGKWLLSSEGLWQASSAGLRMGYWRRTSGTPADVGMRWRSTAGANTDYTAMALTPRVLALTAADTLQFMAFQNSGGALNYSDTTPYCAWAELRYIGA